jgi:ribosome-associated protein
MEIVDEQLLAPILEGIQKVKGKNIVVLDLSEIPQSVARNFVICTGDSHVQVSAIADAIDEEVGKKVGESPWHKEGLQNRQWVILDYIDVVVHIFHKDWRDFYNLEGLWGDAKFQHIED